MNWFEAVGYAGLGLAALAAFIGLMAWSFTAWEYGDWLEKVGNFAAWAMLIGTLIWFVNRQGVPA